VVPVRRSSDMQLVAYALARCGAANPKGGASLPPVWLGVSGWGQAYDLFHEALADGRPGKSFANSLKNARDAFDAHVPSGRVGWVDHSNGVPYRQDTMVGRILAQWGSRSDEELCNAVLAILDGAPSGSRPEESVRTEGGQKCIWCGIMSATLRSERRLFVCMERDAWDADSTLKRRTVSTVKAILRCITVCLWPSMECGRQTPRATWSVSARTVTAWSTGGGLSVFHWMSSGRSWQSRRPNHQTNAGHDVQSGRLDMCISGQPKRVQ